PTHRPEVAAAGPQWRRPLLELVDALVDEGLFRDADVHEISTSIWASLHGVVSLEIGVWREAPSAEQYFETQVAATLRSWTAGGSAAATGAAAGDDRQALLLHPRRREVRPHQVCAERLDRRGGQRPRGGHSRG